MQSLDWNPWLVGLHVKMAFEPGVASQFQVKALPSSKVKASTFNRSRTRCFLIVKASWLCSLPPLAPEHEMKPSQRLIGGVQGPKEYERGCFGDGGFGASGPESTLRGLRGLRSLETEKSLWFVSSTWFVGLRCGYLHFCERRFFAEYRSCRL